MATVSNMAAVCRAPKWWWKNDNLAALSDDNREARIATGVRSFRIRTPEKWFETGKENKENREKRFTKPKKLKNKNSNIYRRRQSSSGVP